MPIRRVAEHVSRTFGIDQTTLGTGQLDASVRARMSTIGSSSISDYERTLGQSHEESQALFELLAIPESWFFRDKAPFELLKESAARRLLDDPGLGSLRVLSLPCANGEEPYSIAITLLEAGLRPAQIKIDAADASFEAIERARKGIFTQRSFRARSPESFTTHLVPHPDGWEVAASVRELVRFFKANLLDADALKDVQKYDYIFSRNVLIYIDDAGKKRAAANLDRLLASGGLLFLGHSDSFGLASDVFVPIRPMAAFAYQRKGEAATDAGSSRVPRARSAPAQPKPKPLERDRRKKVVSDPGSGSKASISRPSEQLKDGAGALVDRAADLANLGKHAEALDLCERAIQEYGQSPTAAAYHLMGALHQAMGQDNKAEDAYVKALYLDPEHEESLWAMALFAQGRGDDRAAPAYRARADRLAGGKGNKA